MYPTLSRQNALLIFSRTLRLNGIYDRDYRSAWPTEKFCLISHCVLYFYDQTLNCICIFYQLSVMGVARVVDGFPRGRKGPTYPSKSIAWLLMSWHASSQEAPTKIQFTSLNTGGANMGHGREHRLMVNTHCTDIPFNLLIIKTHAS